jgi:hypothetical protein
MAFCPRAALSTRLFVGASDGYLYIVSARALSDQMEPFDRDYFTPWLGALRMAMPSIGKDAQRRHGVKEPGLRWGVWAPRLRCGACPMREHRAAHRA